MLQAAAAGESGMVLVTTNSSSADELIRSTAGPDKTAWVAQAVTDLAPSIQQRFHAFDQCAGGVYQIVHHQTMLPSNFADDIHHFSYVRVSAALIDNRQRRVQALSERPGAFHTAGVGRNYG